MCGIQSVGGVITSALDYGTAMFELRPFTCGCVAGRAMDSAFDSWLVEHGIGCFECVGEAETGFAVSLSSHEKGGYGAVASVWRHAHW